MTRIAEGTSGVLVACVLALALSSPAYADVPPGFDLFETDPEQTVFSFREEFTIPPNFFDQGSQPFQGDVQFGGVPLVSFQNRDVGDADTIVRRPEAAALPGPGSNDNVPIELVALSLQSVVPIQVQTDSGPQLWDVFTDLSPARPSQGGMQVFQVNPQGGHFDAGLRVFPRFTFTRLSDGMKREIDVGALNLPQQSQQKLLLQAGPVPWRTGCALPALAIQGLNDGFCAGQVPEGQIPLTSFRAQVVTHDIRPVKPRQEHFKCYVERKPDPPFQPRTVQLEDQFGPGSARVVRPIELCNPVRKNQEPWVNRAAHLECYAIDRANPAFTQRRVLVRNQFGPDALTVAKPFSLCLPTSKTKNRTNPAKLTGAQLIDHFRCYAVSGSQFKQRNVALRDQFGAKSATLLTARLLCAPVRKNSTPSHRPVQHLVCYSLRESSRPTTLPRTVRVRNQFRRKTAVAVKPVSLCVPSLKVRVP